MVTVEAIEQIIAEAVTLSAVNQLESDMLLTEQGIDSLDMATIYLMIEEKYDVKIPDESTDQLLSIESLISFIQKYN